MERTPTTTCTVQSTLYAYTYENGSWTLQNEFTGSGITASTGLIGREELILQGDV